MNGQSVQYKVTNTYQTVTETEREKAKLAASREIYKELLKYLAQKQLITTAA